MNIENKIKYERKNRIQRPHRTTLYLYYPLFPGTAPITQFHTLTMYSVYNKNLF